MLTLPIFMEQFPNTATEDGFGGSANAATLQAFMVAIYELGCLAGALSNLWVGDKLGRKHTIALGGVIMMVGAILQTTAYSYAHMLVGRVVTGVGNGLLTSTVPAYQSECAKPHRRGQLVLWMGSLITFGIMIAYWVNLGCYFIQNEAAWRFPMAFQIFFAVVMIACMYGFKLPDSPRWLVAKGRYAEAVAVLAALDNTSVDDPEVRRTFHGIVDAAMQESKAAFSVRELTTHGKTQHFRRTVLGFLAQMFQQISGINLITYYLTTVLTGMGIGPVLSRILSGVNGTCYFLTSIAALFMVERFGRRPLMLWTALLQAATFAILAGLYKEVKADNKAAQGVSVLMLFLFNTWFSIGWLGMTWLYPAEVTPLRIRAPANAVSTASNWTFNFMVVMGEYGGDTEAVRKAADISDGPNVQHDHVGDVRLLRGDERHHHLPHRLPVLPRDEEVFARGARHHLCQGAHRAPQPCRCEQGGRHPARRLARGRGDPWPHLPRREDARERRHGPPPVPRHQRRVGRAQDVPFRARIGVCAT